MSTAELTGWVAALASLNEATDDSERIDRIRVLEEIKGACAAAQARETVAFVASHCAQQEAAGVRRQDLGRGVGHQVALARREAPSQANRLIGLASALVGEMPHTMADLTSGAIPEFRAQLVVQATAGLSRADRASTDAELAGRLTSMGSKQVADEARRIAYRLDPYAFTERARKAEQDRRVSLRPAPDTMSYLTGSLPAAQGVAAYAALGAEADARRAAGDTRSRGQLMADLLFGALTGRRPTDKPKTWAERVQDVTWDGCQSEPRATSRPTSAARGPATDAPSSPPALAPAVAPATAPASAPIGPGVQVELELLMTDQALLGHGAGAEEPAWLAGYGPIPAPLARRIAAGDLRCRTGEPPGHVERTGEPPGNGDGAQPEDAVPRLDDPVTVWLRRLYARPDDGRLVAMESTRRVFAGGLRRFVRTRDQRCRMPWCDAPIRHVDHVVPAEVGGPTSEANGQGLCEACNYVKQAPGWHAIPSPDGAGDSVLTTTPTGHGYASAPPRAPC